MTEMLPNQLQATDDVYSGRRFTVGLLTGGDDRSYAHGLAIALANAGTMVDFIGSDALDGDELRKHDCIRFLNLRGDQTESAAGQARGE